MRQTVLRKEEPCTAHEDPLLGRGEEARVCTMRLPICQNQVLEESYHNAQRHSTVLLWGKKKLKALRFIIIPYILWKKVRGEKKDTIIGIPVHIHRNYPPPPKNPAHGRNNNKFFCQVCGARVKTRDTLKQHRKKLHNLTTPIPRTAYVLGRICYDYFLNL